MRQVNDSPVISAPAGSRSPRHASDRRGVSAIEYAMMISFISIGIVAAVEHLGSSMSDIFDNVSSGMLSEGDGSGASDKSSSKSGTGSSSGGNSKSVGDGAEDSKKSGGKKSKKSGGKKSKKSGGKKSKSSGGKKSKKSGGKKGKSKGSNKHD